MSIFKIIKKAPNSFWHLYNNGSKEVNLSDFQVVLDSMAQTFNIQCLNGANIPNQSVQIADIRVIDQTAGSLEESFANVSTLKDRLTTLGYTPYKSSTGIEEAPVDGNTYGRKNEGWITITSGGGSLLALPFTTNHLTATGNQYTVGNVVFYNGNVYRCIATNDSILPTNTLYWTNLGAGYPLVQEPADWNATSGNNQILNKPTIGNTPTLAEVLVEGNSTGGENIVINNADSIELENTSSLKKGTYNFGGNGGISRICSNNYEDMWQNGFRHVFDQSGFIRNSTNCFNIIPDETFDDTLRFKVDSLWTLDDGTTYVCTDNTTGAAVWELANQISLQKVLDFNHDLVSGKNLQGTSAGLGNSGMDINAFGTSAALFNTGDALNALGNTSGNNNSGDNVNAFGDFAGNGNTFDYVNLLGQNAAADENGQTVLSKDGIIMARISTTELTDTRKYNLPDADGTLALTSDITTPTLQEVLDAGNAAVDSRIFLSNTANDFETSVNEFGDGQIILKSVVNDTLTNIGAGQVYLGTIDGTDNAIINKDGINVNSVNYAFPSGASSSLATLADITTPTLQEVTDEGNTTNNSIIVNGNNTLDINYQNKLASVAAQSILVANNNTGAFSLMSSDGFIALGNPTNFQTQIAANNLANNAVEFELPNKTIGTYTLATTADIPTGGSGIPHATAAGTDTYTATITGVTAYNDADAFLIRFTNGNTTGATLNINSLGAKTLYRNNDGVLIGGDIINGGEMLCIYNTSLNGFQVIGTAPNSLFAYVTNADSVTITKGMPVYAFGGTGDRMTVKRANNSTDATSAQTVGLVLSTSITAGQKGLIMMQGLLDGLSILPTATFADGDAVYLGATAGTITNVKPYAPNHLVYLGVVTTASNGSAGRMYVRIQNGYELSEIHDIDLITNAPTNNQVLTYESSTDLWKNKTIIENSITDGVTDKAPSQNAVFDALALKQNSLGYKPYRFIDTANAVSVTGTTAETTLLTITIPPNSFAANDVINIPFLSIVKIGTAGNCSIRLRVSSTNTMATASQIALYTASTTQINPSISRHYSLKGNLLKGLNATTSVVNDILANGTSQVSAAFNTTITQYLFITVTNGSIADSTSLMGVQITN